MKGGRKMSPRDISEAPMVHLNAFTVLEELESASTSIQSNILNKIDDVEELLEEGEATFLNLGISDHCPILLNILEEKNIGPKPFRFFETWTEHEEFKDIVKRGWELPVKNYSNPLLGFAANLKNVKKELKGSNKDHFGDAFKALKEAEAALSDIQDKLSSNNGDDNIVCQENKAKKKLWEALKREETLLKEKSRVKWLQLRDGNNSFFYKAMRGRQHRNNTLEIEGSNRAIVDDLGLIKNEAVEFYKNLFGPKQKDMVFCPSDIPLCGTLSMDQQEMFAIKSTKAPGPDEFGASFFNTPGKL
ncbi:uncharacterized protein LOC122068912 [Macadamia integrifolia]|uniref:uncharacterized protein LOC122068912 n=1 Tax=Macadamia integrifolia TaxID=60698 RepID=UPI001C500786|nr:uncharacterized protein LOC122068912 [Macadamia integrifolia]